jgi:hypothetical protein
MIYSESRLSTDIPPARQPEPPSDSQFEEIMSTTPSPPAPRGKLVLSAAQRAAAAARLNPPAVAEAPAPVPKAATSTGEQRAAEEQQAVEAQAAAEVGAKAARQQIEQRRLAAVRQVEAIFCERFPAVFCLPRVPLAIGIHRQIRARVGNEVTTRPLSAILAWWTKQPDYLEALARGEMRRNLDGYPAVEPNEVARQRAAKRLPKRRTRPPVMNA